jgi:acetoacetyl-CoA synthetase
MKKLLWQPSEQRKNEANITRFIKLVNEKFGLKIISYPQLYNWSIENLTDFWAAIWDFAEIKASQKYDSVAEDMTRFPGTKWFPGARLNFAENLLRYRDNQKAFIFRGETQKTASLTYAELYDKVARLAKSLREIGVVPGDRVAGYMPNMMETAIAMLATTSIGAVWSSCATDIGPQAVLDRFGQVEPNVLFTVNGYYYKGKAFNCLSNVSEIARGLPSLKKVVVATYTEDQPALTEIPNAIYFEEFLAKEDNLEIQFAQLPFDHPVYIMFSSGTTGKPKCMVQGAGGVLINHLKELILHTDLKREDTIFYITTCSWMMWNWLIGSLGVGATILLYDGNPGYPDWSAMWRLLEREKVTYFGTSASYIDFLRSEKVSPGRDYNLSQLKGILQTGSALSPEGFAYVYREIKEDIHFNSIAGGTDINGCFVAGNPISPVYMGELQAPALGMKVKAYDDTGKAIYDQQGELVCELPAPSMPLCFWDDPEGEKYNSAYFNNYPGVWRHGDYIVVHSDTGGITFYGRSDAVLKPSGVRIGTAEIYNQIETLPEIADSLAIGQNWENDQRIILFVKMASGFSLTDEVMTKIKKTLREKASPRHVPALIIAVPDIPYTLNMKKVESAVTNIVNGRPVTNRDALGNPETLEYFEELMKNGTLGR